MSNKTLAITDDISELTSLLKESDAKEIVALRNELTDTWSKVQIYRTEVEMRGSVLNDFKFPTNSSKYWQSVREMNMMFEALMSDSFKLRLNKIEYLKLQRELNECDDELDKMELQVKLDMNLYSRAGMEKNAKDRVREIKEWSKIKGELDDGSFDTENVESHQLESLRMQLENRQRTLSPNSSATEVGNVSGPLKTLNKIANQKRLNKNN